MPYNTLRVLAYKNYLDGIRYEVDRLKEYVGEPRRREKYVSELFEAWKDRAELKKKASDAHKTRGMQSLVDEGSAASKTPQSALTAEFYEYFKNRNLLKNLVASWYEICTGREMNHTDKRRWEFNEKGSPTESKITEFERAKMELEAAIEFVEWIMKLINE